MKNNLNLYITLILVIFLSQLTVGSSKDNSVEYNYNTNFNTIFANELKDNENFYTAYAFPSMDCKMDTTGDDNNKIIHYNFCRLMRRIRYEYAFSNILNIDHLFTVKENNKTSLKMGVVNDCVHFVAKLTHTHPVCTKFPCKNFFPIEVSHHIFKTIYMCMPYEFLIDGYFIKYTITLNIPSITFLFSFCNTVPCDSNDHYYKNIYVNLYLNEDVPTSMSLYCVNIYKCFFLSSYCESFLIKQNGMPSAYSLNIEDENMLFVSSNISKHCYPKTFFPFDEHKFYYPIYYKFKLYINSTNPPDHTPFIPVKYINIVSSTVDNNPIDYENDWDCSFNNYRNSPGGCSLIHYSFRKNISIEFHTPSIFNFQVSSIVSEFFEKFFIEIDHIVEYLFDLIIGNIIRYFYIIIEKIFSYIPGGIHILLDTSVMYLFLSFIITSNYNKLVISILLSYLRYIYFKVY